VNRGRGAARPIFALAAAAAAYAVVLAATGGFETHLIGTRIRSRGWERPAAAAVALWLLSVTLSLRADSGRASRAWAAVSSQRAGRLLAVAAVAWTLCAAARYSSNAAGGSDSFGYVSQAYLFARVELTDQIPLRPEFTWRDAALSLIPLGYVGAAEAERMAPVYPPGLPLMMALALPFGDGAMYAVVPLLGGVVVWCTWLMGRRLGDPLAGGMAAVCLSVSATFLLMHFSPMSDVPVAALWLGAWLAASATFRGAPALAGALAGVAVLTRPNLAPLSLVIGVIAAVSRATSDAPRTKFDVRRALWALAGFMLPFAAAVVGLMVIQWQRYGDPLMSGYGSAGELFALAYVRPNLGSYAARITAIYTPVIWLWLAGAVVIRHTPSRGLLVGGVAFIAVVWLAYIPYLPFEPWFFTRFLLPAIPFMLVLALMVAMATVRRLPVWSRPAVSAAFIAVMIISLSTESQRRGVFESASIERKYPDAGRYVRDHLEGNSYILARQHSGSVRLYSGHPTIRWDVIGGDQLDLVVRTVRGTGSPVYVVMDDDEVPAFARHFEGQRTAGSLRALAQFGQARVYAVE
jgi:hypothetical protein